MTNREIYQRWCETRDRDGNHWPFLVDDIREALVHAGEDQSAIQELEILAGQIMAHPHPDEEYERFEATFDHIQQQLDAVGARWL